MSKAPVRSHTPRLPQPPRPHRRRPGRRSVLLLLVAAAVWLAVPEPAAAQPFGTYLSLVGNPTHGYVRVPHSAALNPTGAFTFEAWVAIRNNPRRRGLPHASPARTSSQAWWVGHCNVGGQPTLRSYLKGGGSLRKGGVIPANVWTHIAVVFTARCGGTTSTASWRRASPEAGPLHHQRQPSCGSAATSPGSSRPQGAIDEVRLWNVARTQAQLRANLNQRITAPQPGLVAVWTLDGNGARRRRAARRQRAGRRHRLPHLPRRRRLRRQHRHDALPRGPLRGERQLAHQPGARAGPTACASVGGHRPGSGLFWFFGADNWEIMVKAINGCGLNNRYWIFSAATTNVFFRMEVFDMQGGGAEDLLQLPRPAGAGGDRHRRLRHLSVGTAHSEAAATVAAASACRATSQAR